MLENNTRTTVDFFGKEYIFERLDPSVIRITTGGSVSFGSFSGKLSIQKKNEFYERPYLIKFKTDILLSPRSTLKLFLKIPVITKLVLRNNGKSMEIDKHIDYNRKTWYGATHRGMLCTYVEAEFSFGDLFETKDALMPLRIINRSDISGEISKIVIEPENLLLVKGDNGLFTNKVRVLFVSSGEFGVEYDDKTITRVINPKLIIDRKISVAKTLLIRFDKLGIARELGF